MARINEGSQFYPPPTPLSMSGINHTCLHPPAAEHSRILVGTHFPSTEGRQLSWSEWLGEILRWFARRKLDGHPSQYFSVASEN